MDGVVLWIGRERNAAPYGGVPKPRKENDYVVSTKRMRRVSTGEDGEVFLNAQHWFSSPLWEKAGGPVLLPGEGPFRCHVSLMVWPFPPRRVKSAAKKGKRHA